jgi:lycopene cyclase domain-containing protein
MIYLRILLFFGLLPLLGLALLAPHHLRRYNGTLLWVVAFVLFVSVPWEAASVNRIWFYSPQVVAGPRFLGIPLEEYIFFILDGSLVTMLALLLRNGRHRASA